MVPLVFYLLFHSMDLDPADFEGHSGLLEEYLCGDIQGIYILHDFAYEVALGTWGNMQWYH